MKIKFSRKTMNLLKKVGCLILALVACLGCVSVFSGISELANDDYQLAVPSYSLGGLDQTTGKKTEDECAIYTKDLIECTGIELYADFDSDIKYVVHFYDEDENWLSCQENEGLNLKVDQMPEGAVGVRIAIYPQNDEDDAVSFMEKYTYASDLTVKVRTKEVKKAN